jgi:hypothetical protein
MVSRPTCGASLRLITSSVSSRTVQRARPSGGGEPTTAIMRCCCCWSRAGALPGRAASNNPRSRPLPRYRLPICHTALAESPRLAPHGWRGLSQIQLTQGQGTQGRAYRLQPASQQLIDLLSIALLEFNLKSYASAHRPDIPPEVVPNKYLQWLPIHADAVLVRHRKGVLDAGFIANGVDQVFAVGGKTFGRER